MSPAAALKPATKTGGAATGAPPRRSSAAASAESPAVAEAPSEVDAEFGWDDTLAAPAGIAPLDAFATGPAYVPRRVEAEPIQPMTMYAIWIGGGAVVLLILLIVGHVLWKAFASGDGETPVASPPAATAPAEPEPEPPATPETTEPSEG
ncbi:MAG: hypothetical protein KJ000_13620 [Pirellulaceae bacterium]|nr:hypothetical protein [Pirellulaceae bacterium]